MPVEIPGFYYDEDKKKYFRIQRNHVLPTSTHVYTHQSVQSIKDKRQAEHDIDQQERKKRASHIRRSKLASTFSYSLLSRRAGGRRSISPASWIQNYFANNVSFRPALLNKSQGLKWTPGDFSNASFSLTSRGRLCFKKRSNSSAIISAEPANNFMRSYYAYDEAFASTTASGGGSPETCTNFLIAAADVPGPRGYLTIFSPNGHNVCVGTLPGIRNSLNFQLRIPCMVWDLAVSPTGQSFAVATAESLRSYQVHNEERESGQYPLLTVPKESFNEQMNVNYKDHNVVMSGERSGRVNFHDCRSGDNVIRLLHSSAVLGTHVTKSMEQIIVHGFSSTSIYDLRYVTAPVFRRNETNIRPKRRRMRGSRSRMSISRDTSTNSTSSIPVLDFRVSNARHSDHYSFGKKIAYSADLDLVVTASSTTKPSGLHQNYVTLYSARNGKMLAGPLTNTCFANEVSCIGMARIRDGTESIITLDERQGLLEWTLHDAMFEQGGYGKNQKKIPRADVVVDYNTDRSISSKWNQGNQAL